MIYIRGGTKKQIESVGNVEERQGKKKLKRCEVQNFNVKKKNQVKH